MHKKEKADNSTQNHLPLSSLSKKMPINCDDESLRFIFLKKEFEASLVRIHSLENENQELKQEVARLKAQVSSLKAHDAERKSVLWKKLQYSLDSKITEKSQQKPSFLVEISEKSPKEDLTEAPVKKERPTRVPTPPPPRPSPSSLKEVDGNKVQLAPPPPPPPPSKTLVGSKAVRRVPEVMEFYRSLMRRDSQSDNKNNPMGFLQVANSRNMIGEIENRSTYLSAVSTLTIYYTVYTYSTSLFHKMSPICSKKRVSFLLIVV